MEAQYWTWPQNEPPPPKVNHPQEGLRVSPRLQDTDPNGIGPHLLQLQDWSQRCV